MRSKYIVSLYILEKAISVLQPRMGPFFQVYRNPLNIFSLRACLATNYFDFALFNLCDKQKNITAVRLCLVWFVTIIIF